MVINGVELLTLAPIVDMLDAKHTKNGVSHGLAEVGYDIRIKQDIVFHPSPTGWGRVCFYDRVSHQTVCYDGNFALASSVEEFALPDHLMGIVHDKSTWARKRISVFNTVIEPGWKGFLTLELVYHGTEKLHIPAGTGIAQVVFHEIAQPAQYQGKYQNQADRPVMSILA